MTACPEIILGSPGNRRITLFQQALARVGQRPATVLPYEELLHSQRAIPKGAVVRIESPGENETVSQLLIRRGAAVTGCDVEAVGRRVDDTEVGEIVFPDLWYAGWSDLLSVLDTTAATWMNSPRDIDVMFNKPSCHAHLQAAGIPLAERLGSVRSYEELRELMRSTDTRRVFIKLESASSASGVVALETSRNRIQATTSTELINAADGPRLFNSLRLQRYTNEHDVAQLISALASYGMTVERWLPKAGWKERTFDLRVVVIAGEVRHLVMRTSQSPLTNLHLGNQRGDVEELLRSIPDTAREAAWDSCRRVADVFSGSLYFGVDLMFTPGFRQHAILEVNAFGDLLPGVLDRGGDTYTAELVAMQETARA